MKNIFNRFKQNTDKEYDMKMCRQLIAEQLKILRTKMNVISKQKEYKILAVSSSIAGEGKTLLSTNLSIQLALSGKKVLLIDADLRKPDVSKYIDIKPAPGLTEYLRGNSKVEDVFQSSNIHGLHVISGGNPDASPDLPASGKFNDLVVSIRNHFDYIIIDTPPVIPVADTIYIKNMVDGVLIVFRLEYTPYDLFGNAVEEVGRDKIIGVVLNNANYSKIVHSKYYSYGYNPAIDNINLSSNVVFNSQP